MIKVQHKNETLLVVIFTCFIGTLSCRNKTSVENLLTDKHKSSFWISKALLPNGAWDYFGVQREFYDNGTLDGLHSTNENKKGRSLIIPCGDDEDDDVIEWSFDQKDSTFKMLPDTYKVTHYNTDTIFLREQTTQQMFALIRPRVQIMDHLTD